VLIMAFSGVLAAMAGIFEVVRYLWEVHRRFFVWHRIHWHRHCVYRASHAAGHPFGVSSVWQSTGGRHAYEHDGWGFRQYR